MTAIPLSPKGQELLNLYKEMADKGYNRADGSFVADAYSDFELRAYKQHIKPILKKFGISTVLDYGAGGSDWQAPGFDESGQSAIDYFGLSAVTKYEPARGVDQRGIADGVICFDVLEHIHILDVRNILIDIFRNAAKLVVINVACYSAAARLPNGENAHITVRQPLWWKGVTDSVSIEFPNVAVWLLCSTGWRQTTDYAIWRAGDWAAQNGFEVKDGFY
jgi:hypothetical protein